MTSPSTFGLLASIPSPSDGTISIGPLDIHAYGLMIALGVVAGVWLFGRRLEEKGIGTRDDANAMAVWAVLAGVIGSRLYHVLTDWSKFENNLSAIPKIWEGGLGIPGGLLAGILTGTFIMRRRDIPVGLACNAVAPALALAQSIGRWGNYFNQELYGRPTTLPWALEIDPEHRIAGYEAYETFHATFLYESLLNLALCGLLLLVDRRFKVRPGHLMAMYIMGYGVIRFFVEGMRIDEADEFGPFRWNQWVALAAVVGGGLYLIITRNKAYVPPVRIDDVGDEAAPDEAEPDDAEAEPDNLTSEDDDASAEEQTEEAEKEPTTAPDLPT